MEKPSGRAFSVGATDAPQTHRTSLSGLECRQKSSALREVVALKQLWLDINEIQDVVALHQRLDDTPQAQK